MVTCPCGTEFKEGNFDCAFFKQAKPAIGKNDWIKTIPASARRVDLFGCGLKEIPDGALSHLKEARVLNLEYNGLKKIGAGAFQGMSKLKVLWLTGHHLRLDDTEAKEYHAVEPRKNQIASVDAAAFSTNTNLAVLLMHHNKLSTLPDTVFKVPAKALRVVKLLDNSLKLTKGVGPLVGLDGVRQLDLDDDSGDRLEDWMENEGHYLDDLNGDESKWWEKEQSEGGQDEDDAGDAADGDDEGRGDL